MMLIMQQLNARAPTDALRFLCNLQLQVAASERRGCVVAHKAQALGGRGQTKRLLVITSSKLQRQTLVLEVDKERSAVPTSEYVLTRGRLIMR